MGQLVIKQTRCDLCGECITLCPFNAITQQGDKIEIGPGCKLCKLCLKNCPWQAIGLTDGKRPTIDKNQWRGILVYAEHHGGNLHPVTLELIGKAKELAEVVGHPVYALLIGDRIGELAKKLLQYPVDKVFTYDAKELRHFRVDVYTNLFADCLQEVKPSIVLVGATSIGRSLAPRVAARFRTGLTADCTTLEIRENTDLVQIRPAFGGNIMAQIITPYTRPQFATVRYKVMPPARPVKEPWGTVVNRTVRPEFLQSAITVREVASREEAPGISEAEVLVVAGRGVREQKDLSLLEELAALLGGQLATTRPLVEMGWARYTQQIGLSGRTVKPKLIITCGVSGAVQFSAGMNTSECIVAINKDRNAPIFQLAHYGVVGDLYAIVPLLIAQIKKGREKIAL